jgi:hypothetical protein
MLTPTITENIVWTNIRNPKYIAADQSYIECEVNFDHLDEEWVVCAVANSQDVDQHIKDIYDACISGQYGAITAFEQPADLDNTSVEFKSLRQSALKFYDAYRQYPDLWDMLSEQEKQDLQTYRSQCISLQTDNPNAICRWDNATNAYGSWENVTLPTRPTISAKTPYGVEEVEL